MVSMLNTTVLIEIIPKTRTVLFTISHEFKLLYETKKTIALLYQVLQWFLHYKIE